MIYNFEGKKLNIPDNVIEHYMKAYSLTKQGAIDMWLDDEGYTENEEQNALDEKAKSVRIDRGACGGSKTKEKKPRAVKISEEKAQIFTEIVEFLGKTYNIDVLIKNKKAGLTLNDKHFTLDLIENRQKKK